MLRHGGGGSGVDFTISVFLFCTFEDFPLILVGLSANPKKRTRFRNQRYFSVHDMVCRIKVESI